MPVNWGFYQSWLPFKEVNVIGTVSSYYIAAVDIVTRVAFRVFLTHVIE
jgi:hypothetical protein